MVFEIRPALVVEVVEQADHAPVLFAFTPLACIASQRGLDREHVFAQAVAGGVLGHQRLRGLA